MFIRLYYRVFSLVKTPKAQVTKERKDKLDSIKIKNFCSSKDSTKKDKKKLRIRENICLSDV